MSKLDRDALCFLPIKTLIELFKTRELSPVDLLNAQIQRIEKYNSKVNAFTYTHFEEALLQAKESEKRYRENKERPLEGITCAIKDDLDLKGWPITKGSLIYKNPYIPETDAALIKRLRDMGVIMHAQTNVPEYYLDFVTWNKLFGVTRNPWNLDYTSGGSSGGSSAALAAGFTTLATGSDIGGSIRMPASMTGLYGFKPPYGRVPTSLVQYESFGPLARCFDDLNLFQNAMAGPSPYLISSLRPKLNYPDGYDDIKGWKLAYDPMDKWGMPVDKVVKKNTEQALEKLISLGATIDEIDVGFRSTDFDLYVKGMLSTSIHDFFFSEPSKNLDLLTPHMKHFVEKYMNKGSAKRQFETEDWINTKSIQIQEMVFQQDYKAIVMPTITTPYVAADMGSSTEKDFVTINGEKYPGNDFAYSFTWPWNLLGQYPVLCVPIGFSPEGIPIGMQIIGNTYDDLAIFQIASEWSSVGPGLYKNDKIPQL